MQILEELWKNDLQIDKPFIHNRQYTEALSRSSDCEKALEDSFSEKQKELFEAYLKSRDDLTIVTDCETYITRFKLGAKIMIDVLTKGEVSKYNAGPVLWDLTTAPVLCRLLYYS